MTTKKQTVEVPTRRPTESELRILGVLWRRGPSSVREVHGELRGEREVGYTTVLKLLQIMTTKGIVRRDERERAHVYEAAEPEASTKRQLAGDLVDRVFAGSARELIAHALGARGASASEVDEIRTLIDRYEREHDERGR